ncbi:hypothetical protein [Streptomyces sp. NBC_00557]|uniref:hypothetical protein n=1 Tax=Streptomyces sp. NBC_00557 TaxID=2975776 RepID=UPI002E81CEA3|nr:hypothetical protein [Streptomyces sp. NBC_00557]WUC32767.1 hypothetical protein OG956_00255 [Streptomyces sp. NBC_00557]
MRRTAMLLAVVLCASLTACGSRDTGRYAAADPKATPTGTKENRYLKSAASLSYAHKHPTDAELLAFPPKWCQDLALEHSVEYVLDPNGGGLYPMGQDWGMLLKDAHELLIVGVTVYCPEYRGQVLKDLRSTGGGL